MAGTFYLADPGRLRAMIEGFHAAAGTAARPRPKAIIAPHAGYVDSGAVAGAAFATLGAEVTQICRAVVIGPAHFVPIRGIALATVDAFRTPLGDVPLDRTALAAIQDLPEVQLTDAPHAPDHALEVELPFLQIALHDFALVPLLVGAARPDEVAQVLARLWGGPETLIVVSSDLSHFHPYAAALRLDAATARAIEAMDETGLGPEAACGHLPIAGLLIQARRQGLRAERVDLRNSGDTAGSRESVVGYGAWTFHGS